MLESKKVARVYLCYALKDKKLLPGLLAQLNALQQQRVIDFWYDGHINPGEKWEDIVSQNIENADIILPLISPDFIASDRKCLNRAFIRCQMQEAFIIPVLLRPCYFQDTPFAHFQVLPRNSVPITSWTNQDNAFFQVAEDIRKTAEQIREASKQQLLPQQKLLSVASRSKVKVVKASSINVRITDPDLLLEPAPRQVTLRYKEHPSYHPSCRKTSRQEEMKVITTNIYKKLLPFLNLLTDVYRYVKSTFTLLDYGNLFLLALLLFGPGFEAALFQNNWDTCMNVLFWNILLSPFVSLLITWLVALFPKWTFWTFFRQRIEITKETFAFCYGCLLCSSTITIANQGAPAFFRFLTSIISLIGGTECIFWLLTIVETWSKALLEDKYE